MDEATKKLFIDYIINRSIDDNISLIDPFDILKYFVKLLPELQDQNSVQTYIDNISNKRKLIEIQSLKDKLVSLNPSIVISEG